jgi:hypothetical protein
MSFVHRTNKPVRSDRGARIPGEISTRSPSRIHIGTTECTNVGSIAILDVTPRSLLRRI